MPISVAEDGSYSINPDPSKMLDHYRSRYNDADHRAAVLQNALEEVLAENVSLKAQVDSLTGQYSTVSPGGEPTLD